MQFHTYHLWAFWALSHSLNLYFIRCLFRHVVVMRLHMKWKWVKKRKKMRIVYRCVFIFDNKHTGDLVWVWLKATIQIRIEWIFFVHDGGGGFNSYIQILRACIGSSQNRRFLWNLLLKFGPNFSICFVRFYKTIHTKTEISFEAHGSKELFYVALVNWIFIRNAQYSIGTFLLSKLLLNPSDSLIHWPHLSNFQVIVK